MIFVGFLPNLRLCHANLLCSINLDFSVEAYQQRFQKSLKRMFLLNRKRTPPIPQTISVFLGTDTQKSMLDVPNPPSATFPGNSNSPAQVAHTSPAVPPDLQNHPAPGENTQYIRLVQLELGKSTQEENQEVTAFMSTSQRHVVLPPTCPTAVAGGVTLDSSLWLWGNQ